jgi:phage shock protein PspC (stress-responsive transcriptional regulator)
MNKKFVRSKDRKIAGVCGGIADSLNIDPVIVRAVFLCLLLFGGSGLIIYLVLLIVMPEADSYTDYIEVDEAGEAKKVKQEPMGKTEASDKKIERRMVNTGSVIFGLLLIFLGIFFFLRNFFPFFRFEYWFPLGLVLVGFILIIFSKKSKKE